MHGTDMSVPRDVYASARWVGFQMTVTSSRGAGCRYVLGPLAIKASARALVRVRGTDPPASLASR
jgi:hypothetical protein